MASRLVLFLLLLSIASMAMAGLPARNIPRHAARPRAAQEAIKSRQLNKTKLQQIRERRELIKKGLLKPRQSAKVYPTCSSSSTSGYARFANYDYLGYDIAGGAIAAANERVCLDYCKQDSSCIGIFWYDGQARPCYKKITRNVNSALIQNAPSRTGNSGATLQGSCAQLEQYYDASKMTACCDTTDRYPTCSVTTLAGWARFPQWDYTGADVNGNPFTDTTEAACQTRCNNAGSSCAGIFWWPSLNRCYLKTSNNANANFRSDTAAAVSSGSSSDFKGTCNIIEGGGIASDRMASCCNSRA